jgi:LPXTG-motif cell wall-anchored protein
MKIITPALKFLNTRISYGGGTDESSSNDNGIEVEDEEEVQTPPEEVPESITASEQEVLAPPAKELPKTGGNTAAYLLSGSALTGLGMILRRFWK